MGGFTVEEITVVGVTQGVTWCNVQASGELCWWSSGVDGAEGAWSIKGIDGSGWGCDRVGMMSEVVELGGKEVETVGVWGRLVVEGG